MFVKLSNGEEVRVGVSHRDADGNPILFDGRRGTKVWINFQDGVVLEARSICKPPDQFCKTSGRRFAANHLLSLVKNKLCEADRKEIFKAICPEFFKKSEVS